MCEFLHHLLAGQLAFVHPLQRGHQRVLHQRQARRRLRVGLLLLFPGVRRVVGGQHVQHVVGQRSGDRLAVGHFLDGRVALDQVALGRIVRAREVQEVHAGFSGDLLAAAIGADQRALLEQRQLVGGGDVQHMQAGAVLARQRHRQPGRLDAGLARTDVRMHVRGQRIAVLFLEGLQVGIDHRRVFAVRDDRGRAFAEDRVQRFRVVDQHVAGRSTHEHLHARGLLRVQRTDRFQVVIAGAVVEAVVGPGAAARELVLGFQDGRIQRRRVGVGHVHEAGQATGHGRGRFAGDVALVGQARFAEMHLVVDHAGQQPAPGGVHHLLAVARRQPVADLRNAAVLDAQVAVEGAAFVDHPGVGDEGGGHVSVFLCNGKRGRGWIRAPDRSRRGGTDGSGPACAQPASCRAAARAGRWHPSRIQNSSARNGSAAPAGG